MPRSVLIQIAFLFLTFPLAANELTVGWISRTPEIPYVWNSSNPRVEGWPKAGSTVTWRANVRNWVDTPKTVRYAWKIDGRQIATGTATLAANSYSTIDLPRPWSFTRERLSFEIDANNSREVFTDALAVGFWVEQGFYDHFRANQHRLGIGSHSFEDWAQRLIELYNDMSAIAVYDVTPNGVHDRWRLQKVVIVPDGALPLVPPVDPQLGNSPSLEGAQPDVSDRTVDIQWGFPSSKVPVYGNFRATGPANGFDLAPILLHEMGHARYLADIYAFDIPSGSAWNTIDIAGIPITNGYAYLSTEQGLMNRNFTFIDRYSAAALNLIAGRRAISGHYNDPENIGVFLNDLPLQNRLTIRDAQGNPVRNANVEIFQSSTEGANQSWYPTHYDATPDLKLRTDANGQVLVGRNPFATNGPVVSYWEKNNTTVIVGAEIDGAKKYGFLESRLFNLAYWSGQTTFADHEVVAGRAAHCATRAPAATAPNWDATLTDRNVKLDWSSVPGAVSYNVYAASPSNPARRFLGTTTSTELTTSLTGGRTYWWVEASFANGCPAMRSESMRLNAVAAPAASKRRAVGRR